MIYLGGNMDLVEKYLGEGKLSWAKTDEVAKKYSGKYKGNEEKGKPWNTYVFKNIEDYRRFADEMQKSYMTIKGDSKKLEMKVWF